MRKSALAAVLAIIAVQTAVAHTDQSTAPRIPFSRGMGFTLYTTGARTELTDPSTYTGLAEKGFDYVRLPVDFRKCSSYSSGTGVCTLNENTTTTTSGGWWSQTTTVLGFSSFDAAIDNAEAAGQYFVLGLGNWSDIDPTNESQRKQFKATWRAVAERYAHRSNRLVFELLETCSVNNADNTKVAKFNSLQREAIAAIRETNPTRLVLFAAADNGNPYMLLKDSTSVSPPADDNNVAVSIFSYHPLEFSNQGYQQVRLTSSHISTLNYGLGETKKYRDNRGIPVVITEFGVNHTRADHGDVTNFLSRITRYCEQNDIPWSPYMYYSANNAKNCCNSDGSLIDYIRAGLFAECAAVDDFDPSSYEKAIEITFPGYSGTTALANFPVLVKLSEDEIYGFHYSDFKKGNGRDLCFTDVNGNLLAHEVDTWNPSGESTVWVKVPSLTATTKIIARYGCAKPVVPKVESVWDSSYVGVWHMGEQKLPLADSTGVSRDITSADGTDIGYGSSGAVGNAVDFGAMNSSRGVNADDHDALDGFAKITVEAWTKQTVHSANSGIVSKRNYSGSNGSMSYYMYDAGGTTAMCYSHDGGSIVSSGVELQPVLGEWNHQVYTLDSTASSANSKGYLNGALKGTGSVSCPGGVFAGAGELHIGNLHSGNTANFPGAVDEVRISRCVRSADWIKASYETVTKSRFANYVVMGSDGHNPTLYVDVAGGATKTLADELEEWTRRVVKTGEGTLVASPGTDVTSMQIEGGTLKLASSAPASVVSSLEVASFLSGTRLDLSGKSYTIAEIKGSPDVLNASTFTLNGGWTILGVDEMAVSGRLVFGANANVALANAALFEGVTHAGIAIASATGGITGMPTIAGDDFELRLSSDGKTLLLCSTIPDEPDWTAFNKSFTIDFGGYAGNSTLVDFPVLVRLSGANIGGFRYSDFRQANGGDLRFSDAAGNLIPHEIDAWNPSGESTVWVRVPSLTRTTQITAHYGCARPVRPLDPKSVWSNGYAGVWHLGESAPTLNESSGSAPGFASSSGAGITYAVDGAVSGAVDFGATGGGRRLDAADHDSLDGFDAFTVEMWTYQTARLAGSGDRSVGILAKRNKYDDQMSWFVHDNGSSIILSVSSDGLSGTVKRLEMTPPELNAWQHVAFVYNSGASDGKYFRGYLEGLSALSGGQNAGRVFAGSGGLHLGCMGIDDSRNFPGRIDEVRISRVARSADWVKASHDTVAGAAFATFSRVASATVSADSRIVAYPEYPSQIVRDYAYGVSVTQGDSTTNLVVYNHCEKSALTTRTRGGDVNRRFCEFAFAGDPVRVDIAVCEDVQSYKVFPSRLRLQSTFNNGVISVWLDEPHSFGIELNDYVKTILTVLVDRPEDPASVPSRNDPSVLYVDGWMDPQNEYGETVIGTDSPYTSVYIAPGAVLNSRLMLRKKNVHVHGRGMVLDPYSDIFRYDKFDSTNGVVFSVGQSASGVLVEDIKLVDARAYNYVITGASTTMRNIKALSSMMCSDGISKYNSKFVVEGGWLYVGDNGLVIGGGGGGVFKDVVIGTSCKAIFPQGSNRNEYLEDIDVFRTDEAMVCNMWNQGTNEQYQSFFFRNLSGVDCTLFPQFFQGMNMGTLQKTFGFENVCIPQSTGSSMWQSIGKKGVAVRFGDDTVKPWTTCNYELSITNIWVAGSRLNGFAESEVANPDRGTVSVVNNLVAPRIPAVPNRKEVGWTCPWKRYIGASLQRDVRFATPEAGEQHLTERALRANLLADNDPTRSIWQATPSYQVKLGAKTFDTDGARIYRSREAKSTGTGMYCDITDAFLRRGNATYRLAFDVRAALITNPVDSVTINAKLVSNERNFQQSFTIPVDGQWHHCTNDFVTAFDLGVTELVGFSLTTSLNGASEIDYKNMSFTNQTEGSDPEDPDPQVPDPDRVLYVNVAAGATNALNSALVTSYVTNIVKQGSGTLVASAISSYSHMITVADGVWQGGASAGDFGGAGTVINVLDGASLVVVGANGARPADNALSGKTINLYGAKNASAKGKMDVLGSGGTIPLGENVNINLHDADAVMYISNGSTWDCANIKSGSVDLGGRKLTIQCANWKQFRTGLAFSNGGTLNFKSLAFYVDETGLCPSFSGTGIVQTDGTLNIKQPISAPGWTIKTTNSLSGNKNRMPTTTDFPGWEGPVQLTSNGAKLANYAGTSPGVSNTVFNLKGAVSGSGNLAIGPGWLNLHSSDNTYSGAVTVKGQSPSTNAAPILAGGGGIGLWNGAACFPNASSVTFTNTARLAFMDLTSCSVPNVKFVALAGETQSISGGVYTARSTMAGFVKEGAGTLVIDSPVSVTGLADVKAGTLKIANLVDPTVQDQTLIMAPLPQLPNLKFASGTTLDLSDNVGVVFTDIQGSPSVTNSGVFGVTGKWTLTSTNGVLKVRGDNATYGSGSAAGVIGFASGSTFDLADETAFRAAVAAAGANGLLVAEANWVMEPSQSAEAGMSLSMPTPAQGLSEGWSMVRGSDGKSVYLRYSDPSASGYNAWVSEKGLTGANAAADKVTNGIANGVRYAFDIDPATSEIGTPILQVVRDGSGNPCVRARDLASGRDDVTFGVLATPDLSDWSQATLVPMEKFDSDSLWKPSASKTSGYVYPAKMFFRYSIEIQ